MPHGPLFLLWALVSSVVADTTLSSPKESPSTVLVIGQQGFTDLSQFTGTLLTAQWVLTARSCLYLNASRIPQFLVYAGGFSYQEYVQRKLPPSAQLLSSYQSYINTRWDIALLKTQGAFRPSEFVGFARLVSDYRYTDRSKHYSWRGYPCVVHGFGSLYPNDTGIYRLKSTVVLNIPCSKRSGCDMAYYTWQKQRIDYACTTQPQERVGAEPRCAVSQGAPAVSMGEVLGVAHTIVEDTGDPNPCVLPPVDGNPCGHPNAIAVFTTLFLKERWIEEMMWPERFPHPFPGCNAFGGAQCYGVYPFILILVVAVSLYHITLSE